MLRFFQMEDQENKVVKLADVCQIDDNFKETGKIGIAEVIVYKAAKNDLLMYKKKLVNE